MPRPSLRLGFACPLSWKDMGEGRVRHCSGCERDIPDLTGMDHRELSAWFARQEGEVCGRFWVNVKTREIVAPRWEVPNGRLAMVALAVAVPVELSREPEPEPPAELYACQQETPEEEARRQAEALRARIEAELDAVVARDPFGTVYAPVLGVPMGPFE